MGARVIGDGWTADKMIARALTKERPDRGLSDDEAKHGMDLIVTSGREDIDALEAYDFLWERVHYGKAF